MSTLAIHGGKPVRDTYLPYGHHSIDEQDKNSVIEALSSDWLTTGPKVIEFEETFAKKVGSKYAVAVNSGTAALHASVFAADIGLGDEVITTPMTFAASANCVLYQGARPVFADIREDTLNIDPDKVKKLVTEKTKAIIAVDYGGQPADIDELKEIASENGLLLIEDAAHSLDATYKGKSIGSLSDLTTFSLHPVKHITTGEGGVIATNDKKMADRIRRFRNHGISTDHHERAEKGTFYYEMMELGYNYRIPDINCALGLSQLKKLDTWVARRREIAGLYNKSLSKMPSIDIPSQLADRESSWHLYLIMLKLDMLSVGRNEIIKALRAENIGVNVHYIPVYWHPYYQNLDYKKGVCPVAEEAYERLITLPLFPAMTERDTKDVIEAVSKVIGFYSV